VALFEIVISQTGRPIKDVKAVKFGGAGVFICRYR
jgi:hypothetical protein